MIKACFSASEHSSCETTGRSGFPNALHVWQLELLSSFLFEQAVIEKNKINKYGRQALIFITEGFNCFSNICYEKSECITPKGSFL